MRKDATDTSSGNDDMCDHQFVRAPASPVDVQKEDEGGWVQRLMRRLMDSVRRGRGTS